MNNDEIKPVFDEEGLKSNAKIIVIGVGGGGGNAVNSMINDKSEDVEYWVVNTDSQALANSPCDNKLILGRNITKGLGAGGLPEIGQKAAEDSYNDLKLIVKGADMVFIAAGEGGGTGTGAAPVVAKAAKEEGCLVLAIVTRPFTFEGKARKLRALEGISKLKEYADAIIIVSNDKMMFNNGGLGFKNSFAASDEILASSVKTVTDLILIHGIINLDFADVKATLANKGLALIGIGFGEGKNKAIDAATNAINSPLLEASIRGSRSMIINFTVGNDTTLDEVSNAINHITEAAGGQENNVSIIFGVQSDDSYDSKMKVAIIATDFEKNLANETPSQAPQREQMVTDISSNQNISKTEFVEKEDPSLKKNESSKEDSVLPDYLRNFFNCDEPKVDEKVENVKKAEEKMRIEDLKTPTLSSQPIKQEEDDEDSIIIDRKI